LKDTADAVTKKIIEQVLSQESVVEVVMNALEMKTIPEGKEFDQKTAEDIYLVSSGDFEQVGSTGKKVSDGGLLGFWLEGSSYKATRESRVWSMDKASFQILTRGRKFEEMVDLEDPLSSATTTKSNDSPKQQGSPGYAGR